MEWVGLYCVVGRLYSLSAICQIELFHVQQLDRKWTSVFPWQHRVCHASTRVVSHAVESIQSKLISAL